MDDRDIIALYWQRAERAIHETAAKYGGLCYTIAHNILSSREDSEECVNDTYLGLWNAIPPQKPERFSAFVARVTRNLALKRFDHVNAQKRNPVAVRSLEGLDDAGYLFTVECRQGSCDPAADFAARQYVIASTPKETYFLILPSDVQYDPNNAAVAQEYLNMSQQIGEVQVLLSDWLGE